MRVCVSVEFISVCWHVIDFPTIVKLSIISYMSYKYKYTFTIDTYIIIERLVDFVAGHYWFSLSCYLQLNLVPFLILFVNN